MQAAQNNRPQRILQGPPLPPNSKAHGNYLSPREPYLTRTNSNSKSFKKTSVEKSIRHNEFQKEIKYAVPNRIQASLQKSLVQSENNFDPISIRSPFEDSKLTLNQTKTYSKSKKCDREESKDRVNQAKPFDVLSAATAFNEEKNRDKNNQYYLYWKTKAHQYLEQNMKLTEDIRRLTRQNDQLKQSLQMLNSNTKSAKNSQAKNSQIVNQVIKKEQSRQNAYLIQKIEQMQRSLKKKEIIIKSYQEKIMQLNSKLVGDNQRTRLINKLKSEIDSLRSQLNASQLINKRDYSSGYKDSVSEKYKSINRKQESKLRDFQRR